MSDINDKRIKNKEDWKDILKNEKQEDNIILEILFYMMGCTNRTSNALNIQKALNLNGMPNLEIVRFGKRIVELKGIPEQKASEGNNRYWNIPFETDPSKNKNIFTWKIRDELAEALIELYNLSDENVNSVTEQFKDYLEMLPPEEYEERIKEQIEIRDNFVKRFNINYIMNMTLEDFVTGRSKIDEKGKNAFCYLLESKMMQLGGMRGATADKFGVYYSKEQKYEFAKKYGETLEEAFYNIKEEICKLIVAGNNEEYAEMSQSMLSPLFKGKILSTYFHDKYLSIFKEEDIDKFLYHLGITYDIHITNTVEKKKILLKEYKDKHPIFNKYSDYYFVIFLYNAFKKELKEKNTVNGAIDYKIELVDFNYIGTHNTKKKETYRSRETDYEKINKNKKDIGNRGEIAILQYEKDRLNNLGLNNLAENVSIAENDAIGYDIISFDDNGNEIHIEVKTNSGNSDKLMEFYLTENEFNKMIEDPTYNIYYLYSIKNKPKLHIINKDILMQEKEVYLKPVLYKIAIDVEKKL